MEKLRFWLLRKEVSQKPEGCKPNQRFLGKLYFFKMIVKKNKKYNVCTALKNAKHF
jgi:hypothetical protein